jgi:molybdenum cofactor guanylyltransferase
VYVDGDGRYQILCGVWRTAALRAALDRQPEHHGAALRHLLAGLRTGTVSHDGAGPPPWYDCDSPEDLDRAEGWT